METLFLFSVEPLYFLKKIFQGRELLRTYIYTMCTLIAITFFSKNNNNNNKSRKSILILSSYHLRILIKLMSAVE